MSIRSSFLLAVLTFASLGAAHTKALRPIEGQSINLGDVSGVAYYTVEPDGFRVVTTLAQGEAGTPIRFVAVLAPGPRHPHSKSAEKAMNCWSARQARPIEVQWAGECLREGAIIGGPLTAIAYLPRSSPRLFRRSSPSACWYCLK
jgi:hypothetical protein